MLLIVLMNNRADYLNIAKLLFTRVIVRNPTLPVQLITISANNVVTLEPELPEPPSVELINCVDKLIGETSAQCRLEDETKLSVAFKVVVQHVISLTERHGDEASTSKSKKSVVKPQFEVIILTNLINSLISDKYADKIISEFKEENIRCFLFSENVSYPIKSGTRDADLVNIIKDPTLLSTEIAQLRRIILETNGFIGNLDFSASLFENVRFRKAPQAWNVNFRIGSHIIIPVSGYRKTIGYEEPKWLYTPLKHSSEEENLKAPTPLEDDFKKEDIDKQFDVHQTKSDGKVLLTKEEKKAHKPKTERCLDLLFTMNKEDVVEVHHESPVYFIKPNPKKPEHIQAFNSFRKALIKQNAVGVARKCYNKNNYPTLVALRPCAFDNTLESFKLPFKDNALNPLDNIHGSLGLWKQPTVDSAYEDGGDDASTKVNAEVHDALDDFFESITVQDDDATHLIPPQLQFNPKLDYLYKMIVQRAQEPQTLPESAMQRINETELECLKNLHVENLQPKTVKKRASDPLNELISKIPARDS